MAERAMTKERHERRGPLVRGAQERSPARIRWALLALCAAIAAMAIAPASSLAIHLGYGQGFQFGSGGTGNGEFQGPYNLAIAVDQSSGKVFIGDVENHRVLIYDADGNFLAAWGYGVSDGQNQSEVCTAPASCQVGIPGPAPGQFKEPIGIAFDYSGGPNDGDVYIVDGNTAVSGGRNLIFKYSPSGTLLGTIDGSSSPNGAFTSVADATVDPQGFLWVTDGVNTMKFSNQTDNHYITGSSFPIGGSAIDTSPDGSKLYVDGFTISPTGTNQHSYTDGGAVVVDRDTGDPFDLANGGIQEYSPSGDPLGPVFATDTVCAIGSNTIAENWTTKTVYLVDACYGPGPITGVIKAFVPFYVPTAITGDPSAVGQNTASLTGQTEPDPDHGGSVNNCHFEYGTDTSYGQVAPCAQPTPYSGQTNVTADLTNLTPDVTYHYRLVSSNSIGANQGIDRTFTPHAVLDTTVGAPSHVTQISATLNGYFTGDGTHDTHSYFEWGTDTTYGNNTPAAPGSDAGVTTGTTNVSADISGLNNYTLYHYRLVTTNALGTTRSPDQTFYSAVPVAPVIQGTSASAVTSSSASVGAFVNPGFGDTTYLFEYGTSSSYGHHTLAGPSIGTDSTFHSVSSDLIGLEPGTTYHYRIVAVNFGGVSHGPDASFTTTDVPRIAASSISEVGQTTATLAAVINPSSELTTYHFEYGTDGSYGSRTSERSTGASGSIDQTATASLGGLSPGTTYHFRVIATNAVGKTVGVDQTFTTNAVPVPGDLSTSTRCKKSFVRRNGACVKKKRHGHRNGGHKHG